MNMGISITSNNKKSREAKSILKIRSALASFTFENGTFLKDAELNQIRKCSEVLDEAYKRTT